MTTPAGHIVLVGSMGAGKSTIGRAIAERLGRRLVDGDEELERRTGKTAAAVAASDGAEILHREEAAVVRDVLTGDEPVVLAAAASVVDDDETRDRLRDPAVRVVWVRAPRAVLRRRALAGEHRPFVQGDPDAVLRLDRDRAPRYEDVADVVLDEHDGTDPTRLAATAVDALGA